MTTQALPLFFLPGKSIQQLWDMFDAEGEEMTDSSRKLKPAYGHQVKCFRLETKFSKIHLTSTSLKGLNLYFNSVAT